METQKITYKLTDTGHWLARCDHSTNVIELNKREFFKLSPMYREYVWIHECVHLLYNVYDEAECNRIADEVFLSWSKSDDDRAARVKFIASSNDNEKSHWITALISSAVSIGTMVTSSIVARRNSGYYSLSESDRMIFVDTLLSEAFQASLLTNAQSAKDIFWAKMQPNIARNSEQSYEAWVSKNSFCNDYVSKYEQQYGFGFYDITPINEKAHPQYKKTVRIIGGVVILFAVVILALVLKKNK